MRAFVDKELCIGCGLCEDICPEVFSIGDDGKAVATDDQIPEDIIEDARDAMDQCPTEAITIE